MSESKKFTPGEIKYRCRRCSDIFWSRHEGEFRSCRCGSVSVDQTAYYTRGIGDIDNLEMVDDTSTT